MNTQNPKDLIPVSEARRLLSVSPYKIARLIKEEQLHTYPNHLDKRIKFVSKKDVLALIPDSEEKAA